MIPIAACGLRGKPLNESNLGHSKAWLAGAGRANYQPVARASHLRWGTSAATPFATGAISLVWSQFPTASGAELRLAFMQAHARARTNVTHLC
jgi:subtilisin family serine protease